LNIVHTAPTGDVDAGDALLVQDALARLEARLDLHAPHEVLVEPTA